MTSIRCNCRTECPFPVADCGCTDRGCACFEAGQAPPLDLGIDVPPRRARWDRPEPTDLDEIAGEAS